MNITINITVSDQQELERVVAALGTLQPHAPAAAPAPARANGHNARPVNGENGRHDSDRRGAGITEKQRGAIIAIARQREIDPYASAKQTFGCDLNELTSREASQLIDSLKK